MSSPAQPFFDLRDKLSRTAGDLQNEHYLDALREMLGMMRGGAATQAPVTVAKPMAWTPEPNEEQRQQMAGEQLPQRKAMKNAVPQR